MLPEPLYFATFGNTQSGRVISTAGGVSFTNLVATIVSGVPVYRDGEATGALPGRLVRGASH